MLRNETCKVLCKTEKIPQADVVFIADRIREDYAYNWLIDGLPAAHIKLDPQTNETW
jgi:transmembrane 9 superfamily protein 2/4